jgi:hypothetical protein
MPIMATALLGASLPAGCGGPASGASLTSPNLDAGSDPDGDFFGADATLEGGMPLQVAVEATGCQAGCRSLVAAATGGTPPYHYQWSDGASAASRLACSAPDGGAWSVTVTDTPTSGEFATPAQVQTATLQGMPLACSLDAALPVDARSEDVDAPDESCAASRLRDDTGFCGGSACTFSFCPAGPGFLDTVAYFEWNLPFPLRTGQAYRLSFGAMDAGLNGTDQVTAWGSNGHCGTGEKFPATGQVTSTNATWSFDECVTPSADYSAVTLEFDFGASSGATGDVYLAVCAVGGCGP